MSVNPCDAVFAAENVERQASSLKNRLEIEISAWLESLSIELMNIGQELLEESEKIFSDAETSAKKGVGCSGDFPDIKFIPKMLSKSDVGYFCHGSVLPSSLSLVLLTAIDKVKVGTRLKFGVEGPASTVRGQLKVTVFNPHNSKDEKCMEEVGVGSSLQFSITLPFEGMYTVTATLYDQNIAGSPLVVPLFEDPVKVLRDIGMRRIGDGSIPDEDAGRKGQGRDPVGPTIFQSSVLKELQVQYVIGTLCLAKWDEHDVWYKAKIVNDCREKGVEVSFVNYNKNDIVQRENIVWSETELPQDAVVDLGQDQLTTGDLAVAKWDEDGIWYNAEVKKLEFGGCRVVFVDYGNESFVKTQYIYRDPLDIPEGEVLDTHVESLIQSLEGRQQQKWSVGNVCIARWVEDGKWYNAVVDSVIQSAKNMAATEYFVKFIDYGNSAIVTENGLATSTDEIPIEERTLVDFNVKFTTSENNNVKGTCNDNFIDDITPATEKIKQPLTSKYHEENDSNEHTSLTNDADNKVTKTIMLKKGTKVIVKEDTDNKWQKAVIHEVVAPATFYIVKFMGNGKFGGAAHDNIKLDIDYYEHENAVNQQGGMKTADKIPLISTIDEEFPPETENLPFQTDEVFNNNISHASKEPRPLKPGSYVQAKILANAASAAAGSCSNVRREVPVSQPFCSRGYLNRKGVRVPCSSSVMCGGCALKTGKSEGKDTKITEQEIKCSDPGVKLETVEGLPNTPCIKQKTKSVKLETNTPCIVKSPIDGIWYNGMYDEVYDDGSALVYFIDYGNSERVEEVNIVSGLDDVPHGDVLDPHLLGGFTAEEDGGSIKFLSLLSLKNGFPSLIVKEVLTINNLQGPMGVTVLQDKSLAVVCRDANCVARYNIQGGFLEFLKPGREFVKPSDILTLASGEVLVRDDRGIQLFGRDLQFVKTIAEDWIDHCFGLAEDDEGRIITINNNPCKGDSKVKITAPNTTDVFFIDKVSDRVLKRIEMIDLIEDAVEMLQNGCQETSACRYVAFKNKKLYVVDLGLDCIFILNKDGTESDLLGGRGNNGGEFRDPGGLVVDDSGTMLVVDSRNHRLQLIDNDMCFAGVVEVDKPLARPIGIHVNGMNVLVTNYQGRSLVKYKIVNADTVTTLDV